MPNLLELDLSYNQFNQIEHLGIWRQCHLKQLIASSNPINIELTGSPNNVSECSQYALERLYLSECLNGTVPESLGRLANLRDIDLSGSSLTGTIPESLGRLRYLESLALSWNQLYGSIPESLGRLRYLEALYLSSNQLDGSIPESLGRLRYLEALGLAAERCLEAGMEDVCKYVDSVRSDIIAKIIGRLGLEKAMFETSNAKTPEWFIKQYGTNLNLFVDLFQVLDLERLRGEKYYAAIHIKFKVSKQFINLKQKVNSQKSLPRNSLLKITLIIEHA
ncbi:hypothetical protein L1887_14454 [Cichorium endivia]|nr:hypothetical protein L1887_14454 [Cichorium endivia]